MNDAICRVCGERWDTYHLRHDAPAWVAPLFFAGAGCESCEGVAPEGTDADRIAEESDRNLVIDSPDDRDPLALRPAIAGDTVPAWKRPEDQIVWQCANCPTKIVRDADEREGADRAYCVEATGDYSARYYNERTLGIDRENTFSNLDSARDQISLNGTHCELCAYQCRDCSQVIVEGEDFAGECPDAPYSNDSLCEECFSRAEYESAIGSYDFRDLIEALGYKRGTYVWQWFDNHEPVSFESVDELGLIEIEGDSIRYVAIPSWRHGKEARPERAAILRKLRTLALE